MARTKIVATLGPATDPPGVLKAMLKAGMDVARINLSHAVPGDLPGRIEAVREAARACRRNDVAVLLDTRGPEIRVGELPGGEVHLKEGDEVVLVPAGRGDSTAEAAGHGDPGGSGDGRAVIPVAYGGLTRSVRPGDTVLLDDGNLMLAVVAVDGRRVMCRVDAGGPLRTRKRVTLPRPPRDLRALTPADEEDVKTGLALGADFVAASFVRDADDVLLVHELIEELEASAGVIAKIENAAAVDNLEAILEVADGVMVARGDLGVELPAEDVPVLQKEIIRRCNRAGKPVITATQMLESMVERPRPTRAEASDVANAIFDGTDAVMLSAETSVGRYPVEAVAVMARIAGRAERALNYEKWLERAEGSPPMSVTDAISHACCATAHRLEAAAIVTATQSGHTARMVARHRPAQPLLAVTPSESVARRLALVWGVTSLVVPPVDSFDAVRDEAVRLGWAEGLIQPGDLVVFTAGVPLGVPGTTNLLQVYTAGEVLVSGTGIGRESHSGTVRIIADPARDRPAEPGEVVVCRGTDRDFVPLLTGAGALVAEEGGLTSHAAVVGLHLGIPTIVGAEGALMTLTEGELVTVDAQHGLVYRGRATVR